MADETNQKVAQSDKPFAEWIGKVLAGKTDVPSDLEKKLQDVNQKHQGMVSEAQKAEGALVQIKGQIARLEGAAELLYDLLRKQFEEQSGSASDTPAPEA